MSRVRDFLRHFRLQYRPTHPLTKAVVTAAIVLSTVSLISLRLCQWEAQQKLALLSQQAVHLEQENADLSQRIDALGTVDSIRQIAAEELDLWHPDTIIFEESK